MCTNQSLDNPTQQKVVAPSPWHVQLWIVDADCTFYDKAATPNLDQPTSVRVPPDNTKESTAMLPQFSSTVSALFADLTEARPLIRRELTVKTPNGGQLVTCLVDCAVTFDLVFGDFVRRLAMQNRKSLTKTPLRLANGQRVTSSIVYDVNCELSRHEFQRTFYVLRDLRAANLVLGLPWLDEEHASLQFGTTRAFTLMDGTSIETQLEERRSECLLMSSIKVQKRMRKTRRGKGRNAELYVIDVTPTAAHPREFHTREELIAEQRPSFRSLIYDDFPELKSVDSPPISRQWDHPIETTGPMNRQDLNILSHAKRAELNRELKDAMEADLI
jgi:hypothetical protein